MALAGQVLTTGMLQPDDWTVWAPTYTGITVGNGAVAAAYAVVGGLFLARFRLTWGTTTSFSSTPLIDLPVTVSGDYGVGTDPLGTAFFIDSSVGSSSRQGGTVIHNDNDVFFISDSGPGLTVTSTVPFTWASGDTLACQIMLQRDV